MFMAGIAAHELDAPPALQPPHPPAFASLVLTDEIATIASGIAMNFNMELSPLNRSNSTGSSSNEDGHRIAGLFANRKKIYLREVAQCITNRQAHAVARRRRRLLKTRTKLRSIDRRRHDESGTPNARAELRCRHQIKRQRSTITRSIGGPVSICSTCLEMVGRTTKERLSAGGKIATTNASETGGTTSADTAAGLRATNWQHLPVGVL